MITFHASSPAFFIISLGNLCLPTRRKTPPSIVFYGRMVFCFQILMLGKIEGKRRMGWQRMRWLDSITNLRDRNLSKLREILEDRGVWCATVHGATESDTTYWLNNKSSAPWSQKISGFSLSGCLSHSMLHMELPESINSQKIQVSGKSGS